MAQITPIKPYIGSLLHYVPSEAEKLPRAPHGMQVRYEQPLHAVVLDVIDDRCVSVLVTDITGRQFFVASAQLLQPGDTKIKDVGGMVLGRYAVWPWVEYPAPAPVVTDGTAVPSSASSCH